MTTEVSRCSMCFAPSKYAVFLNEYWEPVSALVSESDDILVGYITTGAGTGKEFIPF